MAVPRLHLSDYLSAGETFHFARSTCVSGSRSPLHAHDFYEMFWINTGRLAHYANGRTATLGAGAVCFIRPDDAHALQAKGGDARITNIAFRRETIDHIGNRYGPALGARAFWASGVLPVQRQLYVAQTRALNIWAHRLDASGRGQLALDAFLLAVLGLLLRDDPLPLGAETGPAWLAESCRALSRPDVLRIGVKGFVAVSGLNPSHVARVCSRHIGKPPSALVAEARMTLAARLLVSTDDPIVEIALEVGHNNLSHFYAQFKAHHGIAPRAYRLQNRYDIVSLKSGR